MKIPLEHLLKDTLSLHVPRTKNDKKKALFKQVAYLPLSILSGNLPLAILTHASAALSSGANQPSKDSLNQLSNYYAFTELPRRRPFNWKSAVIAGSVVSASLIINPQIIDNLYETFSFQADTSLEAYADASLYLGMLFEATKGMYATMKNHLAFSSTSKNHLFNSLSAYFPLSKKQSKEKSVSLAQYLIKKYPLEGLTKTIELYYDEGALPVNFNSDSPKDYVLHAYGEDALGAFVNSLIGFEMNEYQEAFFNKAKEDAIQKKDVSELSLLALYDYKKNNSTNLFKEQIKMVFDDSLLKETILANGTFTKATTLGYTLKKEPLKMTLIQKSSLDGTRLKEKKDLVDLLVPTHKKNVSEIINFSKHEELFVLSELQFRYPLLWDELSKEPRLLFQAYELLGEFQEELSKQKVIPFEKLNVEEKYLNEPLLNSKKYSAHVQSTQNLFEEINDYRPILDFHANNILVAPDRLINIDIENKGLGPKILDIINLTDFSHGAINYHLLQQEKNTLLDSYKSELDMDSSLFDRLYLSALSLRRDSFVMARKNEQGFSDISQINSFMYYCGSVFSFYEKNSTQTQLARSQLEITREVKNLV